MAEPEVAWAAGLFEGEGSIDHRLRKDGRNRRRGLALGSTDLDVVERFRAIVKVGSIIPAPRASRVKIMHYWRARDWGDIEPVLIAMLPWLGVRRSAAARALLADPPKTQGRRGLKHCLRDHPLTEENLWVSPNGKRRNCRACARMNSKARRMNGGR